jgi:hypothetical protein
MATRKFYRDSDPAPEILPRFVVVTAKGGWAAVDADDALRLQAQLAASGIDSKIMEACK